MNKFKYWMYRLKFWLADHGRMEFDVPVHLDIELAGKCNLKCIMCPYAEDSPNRFDETKQGMMPLDMAERLLVEAFRIGVKSVKFNFRGEAGLHKDLEYLITMAKALGFVDVFINTNMLAFSEARLERLARSGIDRLIVSVDGASEETYEYIRRGGDFNKLVRNINLFKRYKKPETRLIIQMVVMDANRHEVEKLKAMGADEYRLVPVQDRGAGEGVEMQERRRCPMPWQRIVIAWNGMAFGCCSNWSNEFPIGQYPENSLLDIWNGDRMKELRSIAINPEKGFPCDKCQVSASFKK